MKLRLVAALTCLYLLAASREPPWGDAHVVYETTARLFGHGKLDVNLGGPPQFYVARGGKKYGVFPLGNVVAMAPGWLLFQALAAVPGAPKELLYRYTCHLPPSLLAACVCALFCSLARREGASRAAALWLSLALGAATILIVYARAPYSEALQTLAFTWCVERAIAVGDRVTRRGALFLGVACGLLFNTKLVYALALPVVPLYLAWCHRREPRRLLEAAACAAPPALLLALLAIAHNWMKTGTLLDTGYQIPEGVFSGDAYAALDGYFFSTGKSVFLYSPPLLLALLAWPSYLRSHRRHALLILCFTGAVTLADAKFRYWHADYCWGPRLLVPLLPSWLLPVAPWIEGALSRGRRALRRVALGLLVGAGLYVQLLGSAFYWDHWIRIAIAVKDQTGAGGWYGEDLHHCHFIPQFSPLVGHAWMLRHVLRGSGDDPLVDAPWHRVAPGKVTLAEWPAVRIDWWALDWFAPREGGGAPGWGVGVVLVLASAGGWSALSLRRRLRAPDDRAA